MEMKKIMQEAWPDLPLGFTVVICILVSDALNEPEAKQRPVSNYVHREMNAIRG